MDKTWQKRENAGVSERGIEVGMADPPQVVGIIIDAHAHIAGSMNSGSNLRLSST